jgi:hypothetical protein
MLRHRYGPGEGAGAPAHPVACVIVLENLSAERRDKAARGTVKFPSTTGDWPLYLTLKIPWQRCVEVDAQSAGREALKEQVARSGGADHHVAPNVVIQTAVGH